MSTGADSKTMPITPEYAEGHERVFGECKGFKGGTFVHRCAVCYGFPIPEGVSGYNCGKCGGKGCVISMPIEDAPSFQAAPKPSLDGIASGRFYEGVSITAADEKGQPLKVDIGSRMKHREYLRRTGFTTADDYKESWTPEAKARAERSAELADDRDRRETIGKIDYEMERRRRK